jgi:sulfatase maturation enzyme AslB (radical SAM superfamily)
MKTNSVLKTVRNLRNAVSTNINRARGVEFIPAKVSTLSIETSSVCNLDCVFCAYGKKQSPKVTMSNDLFASAISQALELGFNDYDLTPCTGDVFMDRHLFDKLTFLDQTPGVKSYGFYTNFAVPRPKDIERLAALKKLSGIGISIYGHDLDTFLKISRTTEANYHRLVRNLAQILDIHKRQKFQMHLALHAGRDSIRGRKSEITDLLEQFAEAGVSIKQQKNVYNNWGGFVTPDDVRELPVKVMSEDAVYKNGACVRLFTTIQIMATGIVNGCACRDADATLRLGDLTTTPLRDIVSTQNPAYQLLIDEQQRGDFRPVCKSCDFYASIYHKSGSYKRNKVPLQTLDQWRETVR